MCKVLINFCFKLDLSSLLIIRFYQTNVSFLINRRILKCKKNCIEISLDELSVNANIYQ